MLVLKRLTGTRVVAAAAALDGAHWPADTLALRIAGDELLLIPPQRDVNLADPYAIVITDGSYQGGWVDEAAGLRFLARHCEWELPAARPALAQGAVAGFPLKLWFAEEQILFIVPAAYAADFLECWHE